MALLVIEEYGVFKYQRVLHDTRLSINGLSRGSNTNRTNLIRTLESFTYLPLKDSNSDELKRISNLVILGESAGD
jgi:hypothetical protein